MSLERSTRHSHYNLNYHVVMVTKYRKELLSSSVASELSRVVAEICEAREWVVMGLEVMPNHVHLFLSCPPKWSPADVVKILKGVLARRLLKAFPDLRQNGHLWTNAYYVGSAGQVSAETIKRYIERQKDA